MKTDFVVCCSAELDEFLLELDEDVEGMQSTIYFLQQQLRQTREQLAAVQKENEVFRSSSNSSSSSLTQCQLAGESSHTTQLERSEPYMQTNGILDHSIHQNEFSSPEQLDPSTAAPAAESGVKQSTKRNAVTSQQSSGDLPEFSFSVVTPIVGFQNRWKL